MRCRRSGQERLGRIVTYNEANGHADIATEARDGTRLQHIVSDDDASSPAWSPNGQLIAYGTTGGIRIIQPNGTLVRSSQNNGNAPTWSRDGSQIAFMVGNWIIGNQQRAARLLA